MGKCPFLSIGKEKEVVCLGTDCELYDEDSLTCAIWNLSYLVKLDDIKGVD